MYALPKSKNYSLEYAFCQTDTFPELNKGVLAAHGVCSVAAQDWLLAKAAGQSFVFSKATITEKARQFDSTEPDYAKIYAQNMPGMTLGKTTEIDFDKKGGDRIVKELAKSPYILIHVGQGLSRRTSGGAHLIVAARLSGGHAMFDSNFGSYKCNNSKGVSAWYSTITNHPRNDKPEGSKKYSDWAANSVIIPFTRN